MEKLCDLQHFLKGLHKKHKKKGLPSKIKLQVNNIPLCPNPKGCNIPDCAEVCQKLYQKLFSLIYTNFHNFYFICNEKECV